VTKPLTLPTVSVVVPVYNEEKRMAACLKALQSQIIKPYEIIVVDNNCTDQTAAVVKKFAGVKIIKEPKQGLVFARNVGFDVAKGTIIGRVDADTIVGPNWVEQVATYFAKNSQLQALSGYGLTRRGTGVPAFTYTLFSKIWSWNYYKQCQAVLGCTVVWGGNMAICRSIWPKVKPLCILNNRIHEDQDLSLALASIGALAKVYPRLLVSIDFYDSQYFAKFWLYLKMQRNTKQAHLAHPRSRYSTRLHIKLGKRVVYWLVTAPAVGIYLLLTMVNSARRYVVAKTKRVLNK
jgi:cellulose synthase/poly-beta-1,6-N-acetylglucosamine synthase-like glycosyltransferase